MGATRYFWEKRRRTRPGRVRFFKFYRAGRVRGRFSLLLVDPMVFVSFGGPDVSDESARSAHFTTISNGGPGQHAALQSSPTKSSRMNHNQRPSLAALHKEGYEPYVLVGGLAAGGGRVPDARSAPPPPNWQNGMYSPSRGYRSVRAPWSGANATLEIPFWRKCAIALV
eukprot:gene13699-biopygen15610